jgi:hypothetical protein
VVRHTKEALPNRTGTMRASENYSSTYFVNKGKRKGRGAMPRSYRPDTSVALLPLTCCARDL